MELIIRRRATYAIQEIFARYEGEQPGLGFEFLSCIEAAAAAITRSPEITPKFYLDFRRRRLRRFPYLLCYRVFDSFVVLAAVFHASRDPGELYALLEDEGV